MRSAFLLFLLASVVAHAQTPTVTSVEVGPGGEIISSFLAADGAVYLLAKEGLAGQPVRYPLWRVGEGQTMELNEVTGFVPRLFGGTPDGTSYVHGARTSPYSGHGAASYGPDGTERWHTDSLSLVLCCVASAISTDGYQYLFSPNQGAHIRQFTPEGVPAWVSALAWETGGCSPYCFFPRGSRVALADTAVYVTTAFQTSVMGPDRVNVDLGRMDPATGAVQWQERATVYTTPGNDPATVPQLTTGVGGQPLLWRAVESFTVTGTGLRGYSFHAYSPEGNPRWTWNRVRPAGSVESPVVAASPTSDRVAGMAGHPARLFVVDGGTLLREDSTTITGAATAAQWVGDAGFYVLGGTGAGGSLYAFGPDGALQQSVTYGEGSYVSKALFLDGTEPVVVVQSARDGTRYADVVRYPSLLASEPGTPPVTPALRLSIRPNPAQEAAVMRYELAGAGHVRLMVYDARGRRVALLRSSPQAAGPQEVRFDASALPPGVYFVRLEAGGAVVTRPLTVVQ